MPPHSDDAGTDIAGAGHYFAFADYQTLYRQFGIIPPRQSGPQAWHSTWSKAPTCPGSQLGTRLPRTQEPHWRRRWGAAWD